MMADQSLLPAKGGALDVIIVGAGIAGLTAAIALRRAGHNITILEKSSMNNEVGAAMLVCPNATRILIPWDLDPVRAQFVRSEGFMWASSETMEPKLSYRYPGMVERYGADLYFAHRVDFHDELKRLAFSADGPGKPPVLHLLSPAVAYDPENGIVKLKDGSEFKGDLIIGADGIHSVAVQTVLGRSVPAESSGTACFRFLIPTQDLLNDPETAPFMDNGESGFRVFVNKEGERLVWYPCRDNTVQNVALLCNDTYEQIGSEDWDLSTTQETLMGRLKDFHPLIKAACQKSTDIKLWRLLIRDPLPTWHRSRLVVIGDAAHPMLPHQGQAGAMAIEDSAAIGKLFENFEDKSVEAISTRLDLFEKIRRNRASVMQIISSTGQEQLEKHMALVAKYLPEDQVPHNPAEVEAFNYGPDVLKDCENELRLLAAQS